MTKPAPGGGRGPGDLPPEGPLAPGQVAIFNLVD
jgi:hypothetical protein